jgi:hypothetical protein
MYTMLSSQRKNLSSDYILRNDIKMSVGLIIVYSLLIIVEPNKPQSGDADTLWPTARSVCNANLQLIQTY